MTKQQLSWGVFEEKLFHLPNLYCLGATIFSEKILTLQKWGRSHSSVFLLCSLSVPKALHSFLPQYASGSAILYPHKDWTYSWDRAGKGPRGLPWWLSGGESPCQCRFDPWPGKILHATEQLNPCATTIEPVLLEPGNCNYWMKPAQPRARAPQQEKPPQWEAHAPQLQSCPCSLQLEKSLPRRPSAAKKK